MDSTFIFKIKEYLVDAGIYNPNDDTATKRRAAGKEFTFEEHLQGLIYSLLTNQRKWYQIEPHLKEVDRIFYNYDVRQILEKSGDYFREKIQSISCGNINIKNQMDALHENIYKLKQIEQDYGSLDAFVTSDKSENIIRALSSYGSKYKLITVGPALAEEYLRNVGIDEAKGDTHLMRFFGSERMGISKSVMASDREVATAVSQVMQDTGLKKFDIDYMIWCYCAEGKGKICTKTPQCNECVIQEYCKKSNILTNKHEDKEDAAKEVLLSTTQSIIFTAKGVDRFYQVIDYAKSRGILFVPFTKAFEQQKYWRLRGNSSINVKDKYIHVYCTSTDKFNIERVTGIKATSNARDPQRPYGFERLTDEQFCKVVDCLLLNDENVL